MKQWTYKIERAVRGYVNIEKQTVHNDTLLIHIEDLLYNPELLINVSILYAIRNSAVTFIDICQKTHLVMKCI